MQNSTDSEVVMNEAVGLTQITIAYENIDDLKKTLLSVAPVTGMDREIVIKDGSRAPLMSAEEVKAITGVSRVVYIHGPDKGPYDAMNQAMRASHGAYLWFLNSGDLLDTPEALRQAWRSVCSDANICLGVFGWKVNGVVVSSPCTAENIVELLRYRWAARHQSMLFKKSCIGDLLYDLNCAITADRKFMLEMLLNSKGGVLVNLDCLLTNNDDSGICRHSIMKKELENLRISYAFFKPRTMLLAIVRFAARVSRYYLVSVLHHLGMCRAVRR